MPNLYHYGDSRPSIPVLPKGEKWHLDLVGPLQEGYGGYKYAAVAVESCTKWPEARPLLNKTADRVESFFHQEVVCRFPVKEVVCDNGTVFAGDFATMAADPGLVLKHTSPYHPQANGMVER